MAGVQYIVNDRGKKTAVIIDLTVYRGLWEDIHDLLVLESRKNEPRSSWTEVKKRLKRNQKNRG